MPKQSILEGELLSAVKDDGIAPPLVLKKKNKIENKNLNVTRRISELGFNPVDIMVMIAQGDSDGLGTTEEVRVFDRLRSASELLSYVAVKPREAVDEEQLGFIPEFIPKRGVNVLELKEED